MEQLLFAWVSAGVSNYQSFDLIRVFLELQQPLWLLQLLDFKNEVFFYERKLNNENKIYSVFADKDCNNNVFKPFSGASFSTSKIVLFLALYINLLLGIFIMLKDFLLQRIEVKKNNVNLDEKNTTVQNKLSAF